MPKIWDQFRKMKRTDIFLFVVFLFLAMWFIQSVIVPRVFDVNMYSDFSVYYYAAEAIQNGADLYNVQEVAQFAEGDFSYWQDIGPYIYPPFFAVVILPFTAFSFIKANAIWTALLLLVLAGFFYYVYRLTKDTISPWILFSAMLLFFPLIKVFQLGQIELIITFGLLGAYGFYKKGKLWPAGVILGALAAIKLYPLFFLIFFLAKRQWKIVTIGVGVFVVLAAGSFLIVPSEYFSTYISEVLPRFLGGESHIQLVEGGESFAGTKYWPSNQSLSGFFAHTFTQTDVSRGIIDSDVFARTAARVVSFIFVATLLYFLYTRRHTKEQDDVLFSFSIITFLLINPLSWEQYFTLSLIVFLLLFLHLSNSQSRKLRVICVLGFLYVVLALRINPWQDVFREGIGLVVLSHKALATSVLWVLIVCMLRKRSLRSP